MTYFKDIGVSLSDGEVSPWYVLSKKSNIQKGLSTWTMLDNPKFRSKKYWTRLATEVPVKMLKINSKMIKFGLPT